MLIFFGLSMAFACEDLNDVPSTVQVAWISPVREQVWFNQNIEVVRYQDLRLWLGAEDANAKDVLHQMGMLSKRSRKDIDPRDYKITIFDVEKEWLCRPMTEEVEGSVVQGVPVCPAKQSKPARYYTRYGFTGCGYTFNTQRANRGFDVYRVSWTDAATWGFCVMPLERFLEGPQK